MIKSLPKPSTTALTVALAVLMCGIWCTRVSVIAGEDAPNPDSVAKTAKAPEVDKAKPSSTDMMAGIDWSATKQSFLDEKGAVVLSGSAYVRYSGVKLEADNIVFFRETREMYAEGHCRMHVGESEMAASAAYIDVDSDSGYLVDAEIRMTADPIALGKSQTNKNYGINENAQLRAAEKERVDKSTNRHTQALPGETPTYSNKDPYGAYLDAQSDPQARVSFILKADKLIRHSKLHYTTENAFLTNDEMAHPIYGVKAKTMDFYMHEIPDFKNPGKTTLAAEKVVAEKGRLQIFGYDLLPFPTVTYDMANKREFFKFIQGNSGQWGNYVLMRFGYDSGPAKGELQTRPFQFTHVYVDLDERQKRGPAAGFVLGWQTQGYQIPGAGTDKLYYEYGLGSVRAYGDAEIQINDADDVVRAKRDLERRIQPKIDGFPRIQFDPNLLFLARRKLDNAGPPSFAIQTHAGDFRGLAELHEHLPVKRLFGIDNIQFDLVYERQSDRDFNLEYFPIAYNRTNQSEALLSARKAGDDYNLELLYRAKPEDFDSSPPRSPFDYGTFTGYQPALTYNTLAKDVGYGVYMSTESQIADMHRSFERDIYNQPGFDTGRLYGKVDFARPYKAFCFLNITPHLGAQGNLYNNSRDNSPYNPGPNVPYTAAGAQAYQNGLDHGKAISQGALTYALDFDTRIYGTFCDLKNDELGIDGLRHIMEPKLTFRGTSNTINNPTKILDFDQYDDLVHQNVITLAFENTFQTRLPVKEGETRTVSLGGIDTSMDYYPSSGDQQRLLGGDSLGLLKLNGFLRVLDVLRLDAGAGFNPQNFTDETAQYKITLDPHERWRLQFSERYNYSDHLRAITGSDQYHIQLDYELSDRWALGFEEVIEKKKTLQLIKGRQIEYYALTRHFGPFDAAFVYSHDRNLNDNGFYGTVRPTIISRNLILPENDPLVNPVTVGGEYESPEERNFDPFQILKQQRMQKKQNNKGGGGGGDAPGPAATSMNGGGKKGAAEAVDLDSLPNSKPKPKKAPIDADEWTLPASLPTSASNR